MDTLPAEVRRLAEALGRLHGPAIIRSESNGYHIYLPSPECLKTDGRKEISSKHLTVNASKYLQLDDWVTKHTTLSKNNDLPSDLHDYSALCHKSGVKYKVTDLLNEALYPTLENRGIKNVKSYLMAASAVNTACLVKDDKGNMVPPNPGEVTAITSLPPLHPAVVYLKARGFNLDSLYKQFKCGFCTAETPIDSDKGIYYKFLPAGFRDTPQGRIIFYAFINGIQTGWQARILDRVSDDGFKEYWHPYQNKWVPMEIKDAVSGKWTPIPGIEISESNYEIAWKPSKYKTAFGMQRNAALIGVDAAVQMNKDLGVKTPTAFLVEGPLDAGKIGPGGVAMMGKYLSDQQADLLSKKFRKLVLLMDNDKAGLEAKARIQKVFHERLMELHFVSVPSAYKDVGEMTHMEAMTLAYNFL
jgi:hypothetical protein